MITREYTIRNEEGEQYASYSSGDFLMEVPIQEGATEDDIQENLDKGLLHNSLLHGWYSSQCRDDVYCDGTLVRQDFTVGLPEGQVLVEKLQEEFPDYVDWTKNEHNIVGAYGNYREPYQNDSISWYDFNAYVTESMQLAYGTSYSNDNLKGWYGLKFDLTTREVMLKVVFNEYDGDLPELPQGEKFFARTHFQDGSSCDLLDVYIYATPQRVWNFCQDKGITYPLPADEHKDCDVVWCWGFVFDKDTLEYGPVKAYARYNLPTQNSNLIE